LYLSGCNGPFADQISQRPTEGPALPVASTESAARVDRIGRKLISGSPFLFVSEPTFQTVGGESGEAPELFHRDATGLFITEGMVRSCKSDDELAAVMASEIGHMVGERRRTERMNLPEPTPSAATLGSLDGMGTMDPARAIELAELDKNFRGPAEKRLIATSDPQRIAADCLRDSGYDPKLLRTVEPILCKARKNHKLASQLAGQ